MVDASSPDAKTPIALGGRKVDTQRRHQSKGSSFESRLNEAPPGSPRFEERRLRKFASLDEQLGALRVSEPEDVARKPKALSDSGVLDLSPNIGRRGSMGSSSLKESLGRILPARADRLGSNSPRPKGETTQESASPRQLESPKEEGPSEHIKKLRTILGGDNEEGYDLTGELFADLQRLVAGIPIQTDEVDFVKSFRAAVEDLWRTGSKIVIEVQKGETIETPQKKHKDAEDESKPWDKPDQNERFLRLLLCFQRGRKSTVCLPEQVEWEREEHVSKWIQKEEEEVKLDEALARFIRSCSQERYTGSMVRSLLLNRYGHQTDTLVPIKVKIQLINVTFTRIFYEDLSNRETILIPLQVFDRRTEEPLDSFTWKLQFHYNSDCSLVKIHLKIV